MELLIPGTGLFFWTVLSFLFLLLPVFALVSLLRANFKDTNTKLIWVLVVLFVPLAGALLYFFIGRRQRVNVA
ncbi:hypothetical protein EPD60_03665 [Flaviaesturariibacter flavus]|uniref:Cardiolipin synthase N-terminal domain-containing protein n=1 Tax=Flaviaesturariibacter flavus TaxID=2502780 RepID=A0A4R1BMG0_9BACT|nr:PLD nuclease N-terminal domain-containing protein [Flaviaesturariibacter flavus]TCJ18609.1 hypothetical protein EPD60_03665 [Flaviaesturariibacter flavus]